MDDLKVKKRTYLSSFLLSVDGREIQRRSTRSLTLVSKRALRLLIQSITFRIGP